MAKSTKQQQPSDSKMVFLFFYF